MATKKKLLQAAAGNAGEDSYWLATLGGAGNDIAFSVELDPSGNIYSIGYSGSEGPGNLSALITKYDSSGNLQWARTLGEAIANEVGYGIAVDSFGDIIACGYTGSEGQGGNDFFLVKYSSSGTLQWQRILGGVSNESPFSLSVDSSNNIILAGSSNSTSASMDCFIAKYNQSGTLQWQKYFGGSDNDAFRGVAVDSSDNIIACGYGYDVGATRYSIYLVKYNSSGSLQWQKDLEGSSLEHDIGYSMALDSIGNIIIGGSTASFGSGSNDIAVIKCNSSGTPLWGRVIGGIDTDVGFDVCVDRQNNVVVCGYERSTNTPIYNAVVAKYDSSGTLQWKRSIGTGVGNFYAYGVVTNSYDSIILGLRATDPVTSSTNHMIAKLPSDGSGTGTYNSITYQASSLTDSAASFTEGTLSYTDNVASLVSATSTLIDEPAILTEQFVEITP